MINCESTNKYIGCTMRTILMNLSSKFLTFQNWLKNETVREIQTRNLKEVLLS